MTHYRGRRDAPAGQRAHAAGDPATAADLRPKIVEVEVVARDAAGDEWSWRHHPRDGDTLTVETRDEIHWPEHPDPFGRRFEPPPPRGWVLTLGRIGTSHWRVPTSSLPLQSLTVDELTAVLAPGAVGW